ncbi:MAG: cell division protein ZapA [Paludibacteraceae bacterium]|nr:cell division protein ZapA [Paludibacteraceae bacterium]
MNDPLSINITVQGKAISLTIERDDEEIVRKAAKELEQRLTAYQAKYPAAAGSESAMLLITALEFAIDALKGERALAEINEQLG